MFLIKSSLLMCSTFRHIHIICDEWFGFGRQKLSQLCPRLNLDLEWCMRLHVTWCACKAWRNAWWASSRGKLQLVFASSWGSIVCNVRFLKRHFSASNVKEQVSCPWVPFFTSVLVRIHRPTLCNAHMYPMILCSSWMFLVCLCLGIVDRFDTMPSQPGLIDGVILESLSPASKLRSMS